MKKTIIYTCVFGFVIGAFYSYGFVMPRTYCIPVTYRTANDCPIIEVDIHDNKYLIMFDTGSKRELTLDKSILDSYQKKEVSKIQWKDIKGVLYESPLYTFPKIKMHGVTWTNIFVSEEKPESPTNIVVDVPFRDSVAKEPVGILGRPFLQHYNLFLDFAHSMITAYHPRKKFCELGYDLKKMAKMPMEIGRGIIIKIDTDIGMQRMGVDTGASHNCIRTFVPQGEEVIKSPYGDDLFVTKKCIAGGRDFGKTSFFLLDITPELHELDGVLGMEFLNKHVVYIDYAHQMVYIGDPLP